MEIIKSWGIAVCFGGLAAALVRMLAPSGALERVFKVAIAAFFLCAFLYPLLSAGSLLSIEWPEGPSVSDTSAASRLDEEVRRQMIRQVEVKIQSYCEEIMADAGCHPQKITVQMDTDGEGRISIEQIDVLLPREELANGASAAAAMQQQLGIRPRIVYQGDVSEVKSG